MRCRRDSTSRNTATKNAGTRKIASTVAVIMPPAMWHRAPDRYAETRPGSSVVSETGAGCIVTTVTAGLGAGGVGNVSSRRSTLHTTQQAIPPTMQRGRCDLYESSCLSFPKGSRGVGCQPKR